MIQWKLKQNKNNKTFPCWRYQFYTMASGAKKSHKIVMIVFLWNLVTINDSDLHKWYQDNYI